MQHELPESLHKTRDTLREPIVAETTSCRDQAGHAKFNICDMFKPVLQCDS